MNKMFLKTTFSAIFLALSPELVLVLVLVEPAPRWSLEPLRPWAHRFPTCLVCFELSWVGSVLAIQLNIKNISLYSIPEEKPKDKDPHLGVGVPPAPVLSPLAVPKAVQLGCPLENLLNLERVSNLLHLLLHLAAKEEIPIWRTILQDPLCLFLSHRRQRQFVSF